MRYTHRGNDARRRRAQRARLAAALGSAPSTRSALPLYRMPSGAGHDAMKLHEVMPQAMLFVRGINSGISHNPLESEHQRRHRSWRCEAFQLLLDNLANESMTMTDYDKLDAWIDAHFDEEVRFLQELVRVPTDTPPGNNAPHAERTAELLQAFGFEAEKHPVPAGGSAGLRPRNRSPT